MNIEKPKSVKLITTCKWIKLITLHHNLLKIIQYKYYTKFHAFNRVLDAQAHCKYL